jgi:dihydrofolate reductase
VKEIFVVGGADIFKTALPDANRIYLTRIHQDFDGDVYFPELNKTEWVLMSSRFCEADEKNKYDHTYQVWERK